MTRTGRPPIEGDLCAVPGCDRPRLRQPGGGRYTLCTAHRNRKYYGKGIKPDEPIGSLRKTRVDVWCAYESAHTRVTRTRGPASGFECVDCGKPAANWSYNRAGAYEFSGENAQGIFLHWSGDPADYDPRCIPCHRIFDQKSR